MTSSNRFVNRLILLIVGLAALVAAGLLALPLLPDAARAIGGVVAPWMDALATVDPFVTLWALAAVMALVAALSIAWIATRGRGRTTSAVATDDIVVDDTVVAGILRRGLDTDPDVLAVSAQAYRRSGGAVLVRVETRSRANLPVLLEHLRSTVADTDNTIGAAVPLVIHLTTGVRTAVSGSRITK